MENPETEVEIIPVLAFLVLCTFLRQQYDADKSCCISNMFEETAYLKSLLEARISVIGKLNSYKLKNTWHLRHNQIYKTIQSKTST